MRGRRLGQEPRGVRGDAQQREGALPRARIAQRPLLPLTIRELDPATAPDELLRAAHAVALACAPDDFILTSDEGIAFMRFPPPSGERRRWVAEEGKDVVGAAAVVRPAGAPSAQIEILVVPAARRRGIGSALLAEVRKAAPGCTLLGEHATVEGAAFARAIGAADDLRSILSVLELQDAALPPAATLEGYRLRSWTAATPDELVESYARARNAIADAPLADGAVLPTWDVARVRDLEAALARRGRQPRVTVALNDAGEVVAFTELRVSPPPTRFATTEDTAVVAAHRRRGLARAVKTESLARLRADRPDLPLVTTSNAEENVAIRALNTQLGFRPSSVWTTAVLRP